VTDTRAAAKLAQNARWVMIGGFGLLILLVAALTLLDFYRLQQARERMNAMGEEHRRAIESMSALLGAHVAMNDALHRVLEGQGPDQVAAAGKAYRNGAARFSRAVDSMRAAFAGTDQAAAMERLLQLSENARSVPDQVAALVFAGKRAEAMDLHEQTSVPLEEEFVSRVNEFLGVYRSHTDRMLREAEAEFRESLAATVALRVGALVTGILIAYVVIRAIGDMSIALRREKERAEVALHSIGDGVITVNAAGLVDNLNPPAERLTGWTEAEARGKPLAEVFRLVDEISREPVPYNLPEGRSSRGGNGVTSGVRLLHRQGREFPVEDTVSAIRGPGGAVAGAIIVFHDVTQLRTMARELSWQASHDPLTGLANRREFEHRLAGMLETARTQEKVHALLYMDLDKFKAVNDQCGHVAGDELLRQLAASMQARIRGSDTLARLGGDEFGVLLEVCPLNQAIRIASGLCELVRDSRFEWKGGTYAVGASVGLVPLDTRSGSVEDLMEAADAACYGAKARGGNRIQIHRQEGAEMMHEHHDVNVVSRIDQAFDHGNFRLYRQAIVPLSRQGRTHYEVLVRMVDELGMPIPPTAFMPTAERYSLLPILDRWVLGTLVDYLAHQGRRAGGDREEVPFYAVNLSGASINDSTFADFLRKLLSAHEPVAELICFEITETTAIANLTKAAELMHELKTLGCRFALDDFGAGVSSFAYLKYLPADYLKIDGAFIRDLARNPMDHAIVEAINRIGHVMGMATVAEFVEDQATVDKLRQLGVDYAQGTAVGEPELMEVRARRRARAR